MRRRLRTGHLTSGKRVVQPWLTEPVSNVVLVHLGGIHDEELLSVSRGYATARRNMDVKSSTNGTSTTTTIGSSGSAKANVGQIYGNTPTVYWKKDYGMATDEDLTADRTVPYPRTLFNTPAYVVLRRTAATNEETSYWSLGVIKKDDYEPNPDDYVISYGDKTDVQSIWSSDIKYFNQTNDHPFKVIYEGESEGDIEVSIIPGTINNQLATNSEVNLTFTAVDTDILARVECDTANDWGPYPKRNGITLITSPSSTQLDDTDQYGYIKLAQVKQDGTVNQFVAGSLWSERQKFTEPGQATYYYYRI